MIEQRPMFMEHRWGQRIRCQARVRISTGSDFIGSGNVRDVSSSGAFIETALRLPVNATVTLVVLGNESAVRAVEIQANVVRVERDGLGVEWRDTPAGSICAVLGCTTRCVAATDPPFIVGHPAKEPPCVASTPHSKK
jgi:hypothetical protein